MHFENENEEPGNIEPASDNDIDTSSSAAEENEGGADPRREIAKAIGWKDKDEYRGRPEDWQDADAFLGRNAALQSEVKELRERVTAQEETYAERLRRIEAANDRIIREDRERLVRELSRAKRVAVELGDVEEFDRLEREENDYFARQVEADRATERQPERKQQQAPDLLPETQDWIRRNSWFTDSQPMQQIALGFYNEAMEGMPASKDESKRLAYVDKRMSEVYPDKLGGGNRSSSVEGGSRSIATSSQITKLTAEERAACRKFIQKGIIKNEAEYIKYLNEYE